MDNNNTQYYEYNNPANTAGKAGGRTLDVENSVMVQTFIFMTLALLISAAAAWITISSPNLLYAILFNSGTLWILIIAEFALVIGCNAMVARDKTAAGIVLFVLYAAVNGMTLSVIFLVFQLSSIVQVFVISAATFAIAAVFGAVTKKDLTRMGSLCMMGLFGIIVAGIINLFMQNTMLDFGICAIGVVIFIGLTAYDVNKIKAMSQQKAYTSVTSLAIFGAMTLYLDFINLFLKLLRLFGKRN